MSDRLPGDERVVAGSFLLLLQLEQFEQFEVVHEGVREVHAPGREVTVVDAGSATGSTLAIGR